MNAHQRKKYAKALMNEMRAATDDEKLQALIDAGRDLAKAASQIDRQYHRIDELEEEVRRIKAHRDEALSALEGIRNKCSLDMHSCDGSLGGYAYGIFNAANNAIASVKDAKR